MTRVTVVHQGRVWRMTRTEYLAMLRALLRNPSHAFAPCELGEDLGAVVDLDRAALLSADDLNTLLKEEGES